MKQRWDVNMRTILSIFILLILFITGCSSKPASVEYIVAHFKDDSAVVIKGFGSVVINNKESIDSDLREKINEYKTKYYHNPELTEKETTISSGFISAVFLYDEEAKRKDDNFNIESFLDNQQRILDVLLSLKSYGFEVQ